MEFEFNFGQQTLSHGIKQNDDIYASVSGVALPLSHEELIFMNRQTGENHVMTHQVLQALSVCQNFKPLSKHIYNISQALPELKGQTRAIEQVTDFLINNKLILQDEEFKNSLSESVEQNIIEDAGIVVRSCDRPRQLKRMLRSLVNYQHKFGSEYTIQVYDDSSSEKQEKEIEAVCKEYSKELNIKFYGRAWQTQFSNMLKNEFQNHSETIDWLLTQEETAFTGGRVWNLALLNNAGKKFLFFDDDYIFEPRIRNQETRKVDINEFSDLSVGFSLSLSEIRENSSEYKHDVLAEMIKSCGMTIGNWLNENDVEISSLENLNLIDLQRIDKNSTIKTTGNGTWGSPRSNSNYWLYYLEGDEKREFWSSRETYLDNIEASNLMHYSDNYECLSLTRFAPSAIDASSMTPFAVPRDRIEDHFFNSLFLFCYPNQISLHFPFMMGHIQTVKRDRSGTNHIAIKPNFNKFIADFALTLVESTDANSPELRLKTLANYVKGLADSSDRKLLNRLKEYLSQMRSDLVLQMQKQIENSPDAPVYWQADVREIIESNGKALIKNDIPLLWNWPEDLSETECVDLARQKINQIADAMEIWPDLWSFCQINK